PRLRGRRAGRGAGRAPDAAQVARAAPRPDRGGAAAADGGAVARAGRRRRAGRGPGGSSVNELHEPTIAARAGAPLESAQAAVVMVHGRGDSAPGILSLASALEAPGVAYVAPATSEERRAGNVGRPR